MHSLVSEVSQHELSMSYLWHSSLSREPPPHTIVNTLGLSPARIDAFEAIALVTVEAFGVYHKPLY
jgi:hypothetical protein